MGTALTFAFGGACIWELAVGPAGNWVLGVLFAAGTASACIAWVALRRLDVVAAARAGGPDHVLRRAHVRSGFVGLACGIAFALLGRIEFGLMGREYGDPGAGFAAGILVGLCILCPAVVFTVGATHAAARRCKADEIERLRASGESLAPWEMHRPGGTVLRHWRGLYNLPRAFWLHGVGVTFGMALFSTAAGLVAIQIDVGLSALVAFGILLLNPPLLVWQMVGIWRSAQRYRAYHRRVWLSALAQGFVVVASGVLAYSFSTGAVGQARELLEILRGDPGWTAFTATLDPSGREVTVRGNLQSGCHWEFARVLASAPKAATVLIDSPGGRLIEGERMAAEVRRRHLDTRAVGDCESAATVVFLAGEHRTLGPKGTLGFHSPSLTGASALMTIAMKFQLDFDMRAAGVSEVFVRRTLDTAPDDMWFPDRSVMRAAGVLTGP
jgi:hypothetical protein